MSRPGFKSKPQRLKPGSLFGYIGTSGTRALPGGFCDEGARIGNDHWRSAMKNDRDWSALVGFSPLAICIVYVWNPLGRREVIFDAGLILLAVWSLWRNPLRGKPGSILFFVLGYAIATIAALVAFSSRHQAASAFWAGVFFVLAGGWWLRYRQNITNEKSFELGAEG